MKKTVRKTRKRTNNWSWKNFKFLVRLKKIFKLFLISAFAIAFSLALVFGVLFYKFIKSPLAASYDATNDQQIRSGEPFSLSFIVLDSKKDEAPRISSLYLVTYGGVNKDVNLFSIPVKAEVELPLGLSQSSLARVYSLGNIVQKNKGVNLTNLVIGRIFGKRVDRYILTDLNGIKELSDLYEVRHYEDLSNVTSLKNISKSIDAARIVKSDFESNLSSEELLYILSLLHKQSQNIKQTELSSEDLLNDFALDKTMSDIFINEGVISEQKRIVVLNAANIPRLGYKASRFIQNFGGSIVNTANAPKVFEKSVIVSDDLTSETLKKVSHELNIKDVVGVEELSTLGLEDSKGLGADIIVVVGIDYASGL